MLLLPTSRRVGILEIASTACGFALEVGKFDPFSEERLACPTSWPFQVGFMYFSEGGHSERRCTGASEQIKLSRSAGEMPVPTPSPIHAGGRGHSAAPWQFSAVFIEIEAALLFPSTAQSNPTLRPERTRLLCARVILISTCLTPSLHTSPVASRSRTSITCCDDGGLCAIEDRILCILTCDFRSLDVEAGLILEPHLLVVAT